MGAHGRHTRSAAYKHHPGIGVLGEKLVERPINSHLVAGFREKTQDDICPGGTSVPGGGAAIRIVNLRMPFPSG